MMAVFKSSFKQSMIVFGISVIYFFVLHGGYDFLTQYKYWFTEYCANVLGISIIYFVMSLAFNYVIITWTLDLRKH